jgi:hypothetical protein
LGGNYEKLKEKMTLVSELKGNNDDMELNRYQPYDM